MQKWTWSGQNLLKARQEMESNISKLESEKTLWKVQLEKLQMVLTNMNQLKFASMAPLF